MVDESAPAGEAGQGVLGTDATWPNLANAYRWCLRAYPKWYWRDNGDDLVWLLTDLHAGEQDASMRECASILRAGLARRLTHRYRYWLPGLLWLEALALLFYLGRTIDTALTQHQTLSYTALLQVRDQIQFRTAWFVIFAVPCLVGAAALIWLGIRISRGGTRALLGGTAEWSPGLMVRVGLLAQPILVAGLAASGDDDSGWGAGRLVTLAIGVVGLVLVARNLRTRHGFTVPSGVLSALLAAVLGCCLVLPGVISRHGPGGIPLGDWGFTSQVVAPTGRLLPSGVACPAQGHCYVAGFSEAGWMVAGEVVGWAVSGVAMTTDGTHWQIEPTRNAAGGLLSEMVCPAVDECFLSALGGPNVTRLARSLDGGRKWTFTSLSDVLLGTLACPTAQTCIAVRQYSGSPASPSTDAVVTTDDAGRLWTKTFTFPGSASFPGGADIACAGVTYCVIVGDALPGDQSWLLYTSRDGGKTWTSRALLIPPEYRPTAVACPAPDRCLVTSSHGLYLTSNGGGTWTKTSSRATGMIDCVSAAVCWSESNLGNALLRSSDGAETWQKTATVPAIKYVRQFSCPTALECVTAGLTAANSPVIVTTDDGGRSWSETPFPKLPPQDLPKPVVIP
ncbi:MAG: WD40/YVTN/BNR-like repeat-containing protein [Acidimicrobiales bacterium]